MVCIFFSGISGPCSGLFACYVRKHLPYSTRISSDLKVSPSNARNNFGFSRNLRSSQIRMLREQPRGCGSEGERGIAERDSYLVVIYVICDP